MHFHKYGFYGMFLKSPFSYPFLKNYPAAHTFLQLEKKKGGFMDSFHKLFLEGQKSHGILGIPFILEICGIPHLLL